MQLSTRAVECVSMNRLTYSHLDPTQSNIDTASLNAVNDEQMVPKQWTNSGLQIDKQIENADVDNHPSLDKVPYVTVVDFLISALYPRYNASSGSKEKMWVWGSHTY